MDFENLVCSVASDVQCVSRDGRTSRWRSDQQNSGGLGLRRCTGWIGTYVISYEYRWRINQEQNKEINAWVPGIFGGDSTCGHWRVPQSNCIKSVVISCMKASLADTHINVTVYGV